MKKSNDEAKIKIIPLGGVQEIGMNITVIEYGNEVIIIDCGFMFPKYHMLGIDYVIPDTNYLEGKNIVGMFLTHGHEDHIGSIPHILRKFPNIQIHGTRLTIAFLQAKLNDYRGEYKNVRLKELLPRTKIQVGLNFEIEFIRVNHSIPDSVGIAITTPLGVIIHTGDFKIDLNPINGNFIDLYKFAEYGEKGVLLMLSDSTNVEKSGFSLSESVVAKKMNSIFKHNEGMIIVATFASSIERIQDLVNAAKNNGKYVAFSGRSLLKYTKIAEDLGYLDLYKNLIIPIEKIHKYPRNKVVCITTGTQGEPYSSLTLISSNSHRHIRVEEGDLVIFSSSVIPGNEIYVTKMINNLFDLGAKLVEEDKKLLHVSGHASSEDLKLMYRLIKPKYFIPIHGEKRHLIKHIKLIESLIGLETNGFLLYNGNVLTIDENLEAAIGDPIDMKNIYVDGKGVGGLEEGIFSDRAQLSINGVVVVHINIYKTANGYNIITNVDSRGFVYNGGEKDSLKKNEALIREAKNVATDSVKRLLDRNKKNLSTMRYEVKESLKRKFIHLLGKEPVIFACINMVSQDMLNTMPNDIQNKVIDEIKDNGNAEGELACKKSIEKKVKEQPKKKPLKKKIKEKIKVEEQE